MSKLIIMVGLPGSGKSAYTAKYETQNRTTIVSTDEIRRELYGNPETQGTAQDVFNEAYRRIEIALRAGDTVVFDATNLKARNRKYLCNRFRPIADTIVPSIWRLVLTSASQEMTTEAARLALG